MVTCGRRLGPLKITFVPPFALLATFSPRPGTRENAGQPIVPLVAGRPKI